MADILSVSLFARDHAYRTMNVGNVENGLVGMIQKGRNLNQVRKELEQSPFSFQIEKETLAIQRVTEAQSKGQPTGVYNRYGMEEVNQGAPYSYLADENGLIQHNGVTFVCDNLRNQICLGDMSREEDIITIPLSEGGTLRVNRGNITDLSKALDMFSPEDVERILRAISVDKKAESKKAEVEEEESNSYKKMLDKENQEPEKAENKSQEHKKL